MFGELSPPKPVATGLGRGIGPSALCKMGATGAKVPFHNSIIVNFMIYQNWLKTNLLQLFGHPENSEWFSIISAIIFEVNIVDEQKQTQLVMIFCFCKFPLPSTLLLLPCHCSAVPECTCVNKLANVNITSRCDVTNSVCPATMTTIRHCSIPEFGRGIQLSSRPGHRQTCTPLRT